MKKEETFLLDCDCGCSFLRFVYDEEWGMLLDHFVMSFYSKQQNIGDRIRNALKMIWCAITGKEFHLYEIVIDPKDLERFKKFVANL